MLSSLHFVRKNLVKHNSDSAGEFGRRQVAGELDFDVARLTVASHDSAPDDSGSGFLAVNEHGVLGGFVDESDSLAQVPLATFVVVDSFELDDGLVHGLGFETSAVAGKDASDVKSTFGHGCCFFLLKQKYRNYF